jgi:hypothetical protein
VAIVRARKEDGKGCGLKGRRRFGRRRERRAAADLVRNGMRER